MAENQMIVSDLGLLNINKKIADIRKYAKDLIETQGDVYIENGVASNFNEESYLYNNVELTDSTITISSSGYFYPTDGEQVLWLLGGDDLNKNAVALQFDNNQVTLAYTINSEENPVKVALKATHLGLESNTKFKTITTISKNKCSLILYIRGIIYQESVDLSIPINIPLLNKLYIGNDPSNLEQFWHGTLNISEFTIAENNNIIYTPSTSSSFTFSKILISDGTYHLQDDTTPIAKHVFQFDFQEITRNGNTILFSLQIDENSKFILKEIGLYITVDGKEILFSYLKGLNINKSDEVPYDLIFTVNLSLEFVNVVGFPDVNSFYLNILQPALLKNFKTVREITFYVMASLERIIYQNAMKIGNNKAQEYYRLQQEIEQGEDCYSNIQSYSKLMKRLRIITEETFTEDNIETYGEVNVSSEGIATNFSSDNFIYGSIKALKDENWTSTFTFQTLDNSSDEVILTFVGEEGSTLGIKSLLLGISNNYLYLKIQNQNSSSYIIDESSLLQIEPNKEYFIKINHVLENNQHTYSILSSEDNINYEVLYTTTTSSFMSSSYTLFLGGEATLNPLTEEYDFSNPFSSGTLYLADCEVFSNSGTWNNIKTVTINDTKLLQYYRIPDLYQSSYKTRDINKPEHTISILENQLTGNNDEIDFSNEKGFTLCLKVHLKNSEPKVILAKTDLVNDPYFILTYFKRTINFTLYMEGQSFSLSKELSTDELSNYQKEPITLTITLDSNRNFKLFKNNDLIADFDGVSGEFKDSSSTFLTNFVQDDILREICNDPVILENLTLEEFIEKVKDNEGKYIQNIIAIQGVINSDDIYYINNLMDTNY